MTIFYISSIYFLSDENFCFPIPEDFCDLQAAPLLCAGLIGYRSYGMSEDAKRIGFYGFGAVAHILIQVAKYQDKQVYAFTRSRDISGQQFARSLSAVWAGIHMSDIPSFPYRVLWEERVLPSVANLTRQDSEEVMIAWTEAY